jgi:hypothetical protein
MPAPPPSLTGGWVWLRVLRRRGSEEHGAGGGRGAGGAADWLGWGA